MALLGLNPDSYPIKGLSFLAFRMEVPTQDERYRKSFPGKHSFLLHFFSKSLVTNAVLSIHVRVRKSNLICVHIFESKAENVENVHFKSGPKLQFRKGYLQIRFIINSSYLLSFIRSVIFSCLIKKFDSFSRSAKL